MIHIAKYIDQPLSGQYVEKIYDITNPWNSSHWCWVKFADNNDEWCGVFRGKYIGGSISNKLGIIVVLTTDYLYILDINTAEMIDYDHHMDYTDITTSCDGDIVLTTGYSIKIIIKENDSIRTKNVLSIPFEIDNVKFIEWNEKILKITCCELYYSKNEFEIYLDIDSLTWNCINLIKQLNE